MEKRMSACFERHPQVYQYPVNETDQNKNIIIHETRYTGIGPRVS
jgi:hypothetical protein